MKQSSALARREAQYYSLSKWKRKALFVFIWTAVRLLTKTIFAGEEHVPADGGIIITTNHLSIVDTPILFLNPARPDITALVARKYQESGAFGVIGNMAGVVWMSRDKADFTAFRDAKDLLRNGRALGVAPEGTRSRTGGLIEGLPGAALLAVKMNVPIVPVAITGSEDTFSRIKRGKRGRIHVQFGKPYKLPPIDRQNREDQLKRSTDEIMCRIAALMPEKYHGVYSNHPRIKEIQRES